jgi:hypothetical protein
MVRRQLFLAWLSLAAVGCTGGGSGSSPMTCTQLPLQMPCGGDLVGTWTLSCNEPLTAGLTVTSPPEERYTFDSSGKYTFSASGPDFVVNIPSADFVPDGGLNSSWESCPMASTNAAAFGGSCAIVGETCACAFPTSAQGQLGTYTTSGNTVMMEQATSAVNVAYCATGSTLTVLTRFANFPTTGVFTRQ